MIKLKTNDLLGLAAFICFFAWQILAGTALKYILLGALIGLCILYCAYKKLISFRFGFLRLCFKKQCKELYLPEYFFKP